MREGTHHVQAAHLQRAHALAQRGLQGILPALLHMDAAPQALQIAQAVLCQPGRELAVGLDFFLQGLECLHAGRQIGPASTLLVHVLLLGAAVFVQLGHSILQLVQAGVGHLGGLLRGAVLGLQIEQALFVRRGQRVFVDGQLLVALI